MRRNLFVFKRRRTAARIGIPIAVVLSQLVSLTPSLAQYGSYQAQPSQEAAAAYSASSPWQVYNPPQSPFAIEVPAGWQVASDANSGQINVAGNGASLAIVPFYAPAAVTAQQLPILFRAMVNQLAPGYNWSVPQGLGANVLKSTATGPNGTASVSMILNQTREGVRGAGVLIISNVPAGAQQAAAETFGRVLASLQIAPAGSGVSYTRFVDPDQASFSIDVPQGWKVTGGMTRPAPADARPWVKAISPDLSMIIMFGDPEIGACSIPTPALAQSGYSEGRHYSPGFGLDTIVMPFQNASTFIQNFANARFAKHLKNMRLECSTEHPEIAQLINGQAPMSSAASAKMSAMFGNVPAVAYLLASTKGTVVQGVPMWFVTTLGGLGARQGKDQQALEIFQHMLQSFQYNPEWERNAVEAGAQTYRINSATTNAISKSVSGGCWKCNPSTGAAQQLASAQVGGMLVTEPQTPTQTFQDPQTGTSFQIQYGSKYQWLKNGGTVLGTGRSQSQSFNWSMVAAP
jgi:uncharacterized protein YbdZ (MbtH family)